MVGHHHHRRRGWVGGQLVERDDELFATTEVEPPDWLRDVIVREVTDEATFRNYELACKRD